MTDDSCFNISEIKISITSLDISSITLKYGITWTENSDVIDSFISEILDREIHTIEFSVQDVFYFPRHGFHGSLSTNISIRGARCSDYDFTLSTESKYLK